MSSQIKIATFNTANLVLPETRYYGKEMYSKDDYNKKIHWIAAQLQSLNADIVAFQEVFHRQALDEAIRLSGIYPVYHLVMDHEHEGRSPASVILSRFEILDHKSISEFPAHSYLKVEEKDIPFRHFRHPIQQAAIRLPNQKLVEVFSIHMKSKRPIMENGHSEDDYDTFAYGMGMARSLYIRTAEAVALRAILSQVMSRNDRAVIVMGDLNDSVHSVTSTIITGEMPQRRFSGDAKKQVMDQILFSTYFMQARNADRDVFFTHIHNGHYENLDHILLSEEFYHHNVHRIGSVEYMKTYNDHLIDSTLTDEELPVWLSDHAQVLVSIELK